MSRFSDKFVLEVKLLVEAPKDWIKNVNQGHSAFVKITDIRSSDSSQAVQNFVEISSPKIGADELIKAISSSKDVKDVDLVRLDPHRIVGMITTQDCPLCSTLSGLNCSLLSASTRDDGKMEWKVLISGEDTLRKITGRLESKGVSCTDSWTHPPDSKERSNRKTGVHSQDCIRTGILRVSKKDKA